MRVELTILGEDAVPRDLIGIGRAAVDLTPVMSDVADVLRSALTRQFDSEGRFGSGGWAPLAPSTVAAKQAAGLDPRILHATRRLRDSLTEPGHPDQIAIARPDGLDFGSTVPYAAFHQHGTSRMPRRRPVQLPESMRRQIPRMIQRGIIIGAGIQFARGFL